MGKLDCSMNVANLKILSLTCALLAMLQLIGLYSNRPRLYPFKFPIEVSVIFVGWVSQSKTWKVGLDLTQPVAKEKMVA